MKSAAIVILMLAAGQAVAVEPYACRNGRFPSSNDVQPAAVSAGAGERVHFRDDVDGCPEGAQCTREAYLVGGDRIMLAQTDGPWACAWYFGKKREFVGWLPAASIKPMPLKPAAIQDWIGTWKPIGGDNEITIARDTAGKLAVSGEAMWHGGKNSYGEEVVHIGELDDVATPAGHRLNLGNAHDADACTAAFQLVNGNLVVADNGSCGGMNIRFNDVYRKAR